MSQIQNQIDSLAEERVFWKLMRAALISKETGKVMSGVKHRVSKMREQYVSRFDVADPNDAIEIAKTQEGRAMCKALMDVFEQDVCNSQIDKLDKKIKELTVKRDRMQTKNGYEALLDS